MRSYKFNGNIIKFVFTVLLMIHVVIGYSQTNIEQRFWNEVKFRRMLKVMPAGLNSWMYSVAQGISGSSYTDALERLERIDKDKALQNAILMEAYCNNYNSKESLRFTLVNLCGSYAIANPVSDIAIARYSTNKKVIALINKRKQDFKHEEKIKAQQEALRVKESEAEEKERVALIEKEKLLKEKKDYEDGLMYRASYIRNHWLNHLTIGDTMLPKYKGGLNSWEENITENVIKVAQSKGIDTVGDVIVGFTVGNKGDISNIEVKKGLGVELDELAVKCIKSSADYWKPAKIGVYIPKAVKFDILYSIWYQPAH